MDQQSAELIHPRQAPSVRVPLPSISVREACTRAALLQRRADRLARQRPALFRAVVLMTIALVSAWAFAPALDRFFAGDHLYYLSELNNDRSLRAGFALLDYSQTRLFWRGDLSLYRPGLFALLAIENTLLGYDPVAWNVVNLILHIACAYLLFELLLTFRFSVAAGGLALLFSVLHASMELVVWNHLGGYLLCFAFLLGAMVCLRRGLISRTPARYAAGCSVLLFGAMLCYEIPVASLPLILLYVLFRTRRGGAARITWLAAVLLPGILFAALYVPRSLNVERDRFFNGTRTSSAAVLADRMLSAITSWTVRIVNPSGRVLLQLPYERFRDTWTGKYATWGLIESLVWFLLFAQLAWRWRWRRLRTCLLDLTLLAGLILVYTAINCLGRDYASSVLYYTYYFAMVGAVALFALVRAQRAPSHTLAAVTGIAIVFSVTNAVLVHEDAQRVARSNAPALQYMQQMQTFQESHRDEPDFSFRVQETPEAVDPYRGIVVGFGDQPLERRSQRASEMLYRKYFSENPSYIVSIEQPFNPQSPRINARRVR